MDIQTVRAFFMWCTIMNGAMLAVSFVILACAGDWAYRMQSKWFPISREAFDVVFNLVPYLALLIVG